MEAYEEEGAAVRGETGGLQGSNERLVPWGYRFVPTDEELIKYLASKLHGLPLPPNPIKEVILYNYTPEELEEEYGVRKEKEMYFFTKLKLKHATGSRPNREACCGFWRASTKKPIKDANGRDIGQKMALNYRNNIDRNLNTDWLMYEYTISSNSKKMNEYVLCKVYNKGGKYKLQNNDQLEKPRESIKQQVQQQDETTAADLYQQNTALQVPQSCCEFCQRQQVFEYLLDSPVADGSFNTEEFPQEGIDPMPEKGFLST